jgi:hypothetical protein
MASFRALVSLRALMASVRAPVTDNYVDDLWLRRCASAGRAMMCPASVAGDRQQVAVEKDMIAVMVATTSGRAMATARRVDHGDSRRVFIFGGFVVGASPASGHGGASKRLFSACEALSMK